MSMMDELDKEIDQLRTELTAANDKIATLESELAGKRKSLNHSIKRENVANDKIAKLREGLEKIWNHAGCEDYYHHFCGCGDELEEIAKEYLEETNG